jgi:HAD superfamily hydrolase (TIGR01490 family)
MRLALFDLDHTLIPFDSGMAWTRFLVQHGRLPADAEACYLGYCEQYVAGTLDIRAMHRASVAPLAGHSMAELSTWLAAFERQMVAQVPPSRRALVQGHLEAGDLCAIVTATTRFVAEPFARLFGIAHLVATEPATDGSHYTGDISGEPCFREHKPHRVRAWLAARGMRLEAFEESHFYSDSMSDLALLTSVTHPVAVDPDVRLLAHAQAAGWPVLRPD